ncbi:MAG: NAD(P) transhydrogenase subunit alpha [Gemmatimonadales bacterium]|nr:MAG: NAD(P) transhydrogenase subunit alpha [Gemmatimonadales bacterium]
MDIALLRESHPLERRVALTPAHLPALSASGITVRVERGAGAGAGFTDQAYAAQGASLHASSADAAGGAALVLRIRPPTLGGQHGPDEVTVLPEGSVLVCHLSPGAEEGLLEALSARGITALALERVPRTTRAQRMDVLSSQATVAGYRAVLRAAGLLPRFFPMLTTAAGTIPPARVLVLGAGVAGLQAIATARRLGAAVTGYDVRPAALEQIRSLGAKALEEDVAGEAEGGYARALSASEQEHQLAFLAHHIRPFDVVVTTAQIPGKPAPRLITADMVASMGPGSVIMDLAAETGGNCELSEAGRTVHHHGVTVDAPLALPAELPWHASEMFGRNITALLQHLVSDGVLELDLEDEITGAMAVTRPPPSQGAVTDG